MAAVHASDCELHNAPASAPGPCSCGASPRFRLWGYDLEHDSFRWREHSRESLVADVVGRALCRCYGVSQKSAVRASTLIGRAVRCGLTKNEKTEIGAVWAHSFAVQPDALVRHGIDDCVAWPTGTFVSASEREEIARPPTDAEISETMEPWFDWWRTLPEPEWKSY